jgi:hypothetical protein
VANLATVREGYKAVLLVVDVQVGVMQYVWNAQRIIKNIGIIEAADIIRELNIAMTWLSYPGRKNSTASVEEVDFAVPGGVR